MTKLKLSEVSVDDVITQVGNVMLLGGKEISEAEKKVLREEAKYLKESRIWKVFQETLKYQAQLVMFEKSKDFNDMLVGKAMLRNLDVQNQILKKLTG